MNPCLRQTQSNLFVMAGRDGHDGIVNARIDEVLNRSPDVEPGSGTVGVTSSVGYGREPHTR